MVLHWVLSSPCFSQSYPLFTAPPHVSSQFTAAAVAISPTQGGGLDSGLHGHPSIPSFFWLTTDRKAKLKLKGISPRAYPRDKFVIANPVIKRCRAFPMDLLKRGQT